MKRVFSTLFVLCCLAFTASAQHPVTSVNEGYQYINLKYVAQTDSCTTVYAVYTKQGSEGIRTLMLGRDTYVNAGGMRYKLLGTYNMPIFDEAEQEYAYLTDDGEELNFVMQFEKFPADAPFDIIENKASKTAFNFFGVRIDPGTDASVDQERFITSTPYNKYTRITLDGHTYVSIIHDNVIVTSFFDTYSDKAFNISIAVDNQSDHGVMLDVSKISVVCDIPKGKNVEYKEYSLVSKGEYADYLASNDYYIAEQQSGTRALSELGSVIRSSSYGYRYDSPERIGLDVLGILVEGAKAKKMEPQLKELADEREERLSEYLHSQSIKSGEYYEGVVRINKHRKAQSATVLIPMDGFSFKFLYSF